MMRLLVPRISMKDQTQKNKSDKELQIEGQVSVLVPYLVPCSIVVSAEYLCMVLKAVMKH